MYVFLDLDGTLIGPSGWISDAVWSAIDAARDAGFKLAVCTGRPRGGVSQRAARRIDPDGPHIFENGALIAPADGDPWVAQSLDLSDLEILVRQTQHTDAVLEFYTPAGIFVSAYNEDCREHERVLEIAVHEADLSQVIREHQVVRAHWIMRPETVDRTLDLTLNASETGVASSPVLPQNIFASITRKGVSKGSAARWVAENAAIPVKDSAAIGDSTGDLPVLELVGRPFVMADSPPELTTRFEVVPDVTRDGAAVALKRLLDSLVTLS